MRKGFSLIEVLVAIGLFTVATTVATTLLVNVSNTQKKAAIQNEVYEDARLLMQQLTKEIQGGTIDYEEYYNIKVAKAPLGGPYYGINYGVYGSRFFDPGRRLDNNNPDSKNPEDLGIECSFPNPLPQNQSCEIVYNLSSDFSTGQNPYKKAASVAENANALCDKKLNGCNVTSHAVSELYLIDATGKHKTIIGRKRMKNAPSQDHSVGLVRMYGIDFDQNGFVDIFSCTKEFTCVAKNLFNDGLQIFPFLSKMRDDLPQDQLAVLTKKYEDLNVHLPQPSDLTTTFNINNSQFLPITPIKSNVKDLKFILNPIEDPYKAYAEDDVQQQPSVTIILTLSLSSDIAKDYPGTFQDLVVQTTVETGVIGGIQSYPSVNDVLRGSSWITNIIPLGANR